MDTRASKTDPDARLYRRSHQAESRLAYLGHLLMTQNLTRRGGSAIDGRTTRLANYAQRQHARPRIEPAFGWLKTIAWLRKVKLRGLANVDWLFVFASAAFNLIRLPKLVPRSS